MQAQEAQLVFDFVQTFLRHVADPLELRGGLLQQGGEVGDAVAFQTDPGARFKNILCKEDAERTTCKKSVFR